MRFRTKLFAAWALLTVLLYASSLAPLLRTISESFQSLTQASFAGTTQSLRGMQAEQITRLHQECTLIMNIPELRPLIAESSSELTAENLASLNERLDNLSTVVGVPAIFILDRRGAVIAQSDRTPWDTLASLRTFLANSTPARAMLGRLYHPRDNPVASTTGTPAEYGIWVVNQHLYQVVAVPLTFSGQDADGIEGAMVVGSPLTDDDAQELARRHNCAVSFLCGNRVVASSHPPQLRRQLVSYLQGLSAAPQHNFTMPLGQASFQSAFEPLIDPCSGQHVGGTLIQSSMREAAGIQSRVWRDLALISLFGLALAALASFVLSTTVTRPVRSLLTGVRRVASGDLQVAIDTPGGGEFAELACAFNDMVEKIRRQRELEHQVEQSRAATKAKSQFLANMSHEIRTPLNGVTGMTELLARTGLTPQQSRYVTLLQTSAKILSTVINDILDFSKIEAGKLELESLDFDLHAALQEVVELLAPKAAAKGLQIHCQVAPGAPTRLRGDAKRLQQIVINLVNNALKFTDSGRITVSAAPEPSPDGRPAMRVVVADTGIGIPPDRLDRLFHSFSQVDASTTRKYGGTGLGLAICKQLAELMGGAIGVSSTPGVGSSFWFTARFDPASEAPAAPISSAPIAPPQRTAHILVAEDNDINQIVVREVLQSAGYTCNVVSDGRAVQPALAARHYDLVLMDCQMPEVDGFEATRQVRRWEQSLPGALPRRIPIIALTASAAQGDRDHCLQCGMDDYISKPIDFPRLGAVIERFLARTLPAAPTTAAQPPASPAPPAPVAAPSINLDRLRQRYANQPRLLPTLLDRFHDQIVKTRGELESLLAHSQLDAFRAAVHALKGSAGYLAADNLVALAGRLETSARQNDLQSLHQQFADLQRELDACLQQIPALRQSVAP